MRSSGESVGAGGCAGASGLPMPRDMSSVDFLCISAIYAGVNPPAGDGSSKVSSTSVS